MHLPPRPVGPGPQNGKWPELEAHGWTIGGNLRIEESYADWHFDLLNALAAELVRKEVDAILCLGDDAVTVAAARATKTIPIVFYQAFSPVEQGFVDSLARPGRNLTGTSVFAGYEFATKRLEFLRAVAPSATRLAWLYGGPSRMLASLTPDAFDAGRMIEESSRSLGFTARVHVVRSPAEVGDALRAAAAWGAHAISAGGSQVYPERAQIAEFGLRERVPTVFSVRDYVADGGLLSYGPPPSEYEALHLRWIAQVDQILRGSNPANMPVERPNRYELCLNAKTAKSIGLTIPRSVSARADLVIG